MKGIWLVVWFIVFGSSWRPVTAQGKPEPTREEKRVMRQAKRAMKKQIDTNRVNRYFVIPAVYYSPETRLAGGLSGLAAFKVNRKDTLTKFSQALLAAIYTQNDQVLLANVFQIFTNRNRYFITGELSYFRYPYVFGGVGNSHEVDELEDYSAYFPRVDVGVMRQISGPFYAGARLFYQNVTVTEQAIGGLLETQPIPGRNGGVNSGIGGLFMYDTRDNQLSPTKGGFVRLSSIPNGPWLGSDFTYTANVFDARIYKNFLKRSIFAANLYAEMNMGDVPFYRMAQLGGPYRMRGFQEGIYRDKQMLVGQVEYSSPIFWRLFTLNAFGSIGGVGRDVEAINQHWRMAGGGGIRIVLDADKRMFLRLDAGFGENTSGFYLSVGEAF